MLASTPLVHAAVVSLAHAGTRATAANPLNDMIPMLQQAELDRRLTKRCDRDTGFRGTSVRPFCAVHCRRGMPQSSDCVQSGQVM